jgi:hypothetical protein
MQREPDTTNLRIIFRGRGVHPTWPNRLEQAQRQTTVSLGGQMIPRIRYGNEGRGWGTPSEPCRDCAAIRGEFHVPGCDMERCPACHAQAIACGCSYDAEL